MNLSERAVQVSLSLSIWQGKADDKTAAAAVEVANTAKRGSTSVRKKLLPGCAEHEQVLTMFNSLRTWNYEQTLPWDDNGGRLLCSGNVLDYMEGFRKHKEDIEKALEAFYAVYPMEQAKAALSLGQLYNAKAYPDVAEIRRKFGINLHMMPLPNSDDFRNFQGFSPEEVEGFITENESAVQGRLQSAMTDVFERLKAPVDAMVERLSIPIGENGSVFRDSLIENLKDVVALLPKLNIAGDEKITAWCAEAEKLICEPEMLRQSVIVRSDTANRAKALAAEMGGWYA